MEVWVRILDVPDGRHAVAGGFDNCRDWGIGMEGSYFKAFYKPPDGCTASIKDSDPVVKGQWYYLVKTTDGQTVSFHVNAKLVGTAAVLPMLPGTSNGFYIGGEKCCGNYFPGEVKSMRVWKRVLDTNEIQESYLKEHLAVDKSTENALNKGLVGHWDFGESKHPPCTGNDHMGADWTVNDGEEIWGVHCNLSHFVIADHATVSVKAWNGDTGTGKLEIFAKDIDIYGTLTATGKGYRGGVGPTATHQAGAIGESFKGGYPTSNTIVTTTGGGGGGGGEADGSNAHGKPGGGGGYGTNGGTCKLRPGKDVSHCGDGGQSYGDDLLKTLYLGSGGGSGGNDNSLSDNPSGGNGGNGGGAIRLDALRHIEVTGLVEVNGEIGQGDVSTSCDVCPPACSDQGGCVGGSNTECYDFSGAGGGGSGGSLYLRGEVVNVGVKQISADGGRGGHGANVACGGDGGRGRIRIDYVDFYGDAPDYAVLTPFDATFPDKSYLGQQQIDLANTVYGNEVFLGCFVDNNPDRLLQNMITLTTDEINQLTPDFCINKCRQLNYKYSGTEYSKECFCDNQLGKQVKTAENECNSPCSGDAQQWCGSGNRITVYGPPPQGGAAVEHNGAVQECKPWCGNSVDQNNQVTTWGECINNGYVSEYTTQCNCNIGYTGDDCSQTCFDWTWGQDCLNQCACTQEHTDLCDPQTGSCKCKSGFKGDRCQYGCSDGMWGVDCTQTCACDVPHASQDSSLPTCDPSSGDCSCVIGYFGSKCDTVCPDGSWGLNCASSCLCQHGACSPTDKLLCWNIIRKLKSQGKITADSFVVYIGYSGINCDQPCDQLHWGSSCVNQCTCNSHPCDSQTGTCNCSPPNSGTHCENGCPPNYWGPTCSSVCNCGPHSLGCDLNDGTCLCDVGYTGTTCELSCPVGSFGEDCAYTCQCDVNNIVKCDAVNGQCQCKPGYSGLQCHTVCPPGTFGDGCSSVCSCQSETCDPITGECQSCPPGFIGLQCSQTCPDNYYGDGCTQLCGCTIHVDSCDPVIGICNCKPGYVGTGCETACDSQHWGADCANPCLCVETNTMQCNPETGACLCKNGFSGSLCEIDCSNGQCAGTGCNCVNQGICLSDGSCDCPVGYNGLKCESICPM
uniref:uncharacterized protein LOC101242430 n=1 Tax=Ciona intestinalis TaxID=7719 RepID=UPI000EF519EE|nr:uncharacterized protein LOC101242430 [Ciona intestinalis]|eukprot:XP_026692657.1 uncharacterized protein LOC101242430 [Ciona intestinalis]